MTVGQHQRKLGSVLTVDVLLRQNGMSRLSGRPHRARHAITQTRTRRARTVGFVSAITGLRRPGVVIQRALVVAQECVFCDGEPRSTAVHIYGDPAPEIHAPIDYAEACVACASEVVDRVLREQNPGSDREIVVEVNA